MIVTLVWNPATTGTIDVRSHWADSESNRYNAWRMQAKKIDITRGSKVYEREHEEAERVQYRVDGGQWIEAGEIGEDDATLTLSL